MARTFKQSLLFVGAVTLWAATGIGCFAGGYAAGWMEGYDFCVAKRSAAEHGLREPPPPTLGRILSPEPARSAR